MSLIGRGSDNSSKYAGASTEVEAVASSSRAPRSKPDRLLLACNPCRKRKVRCDASQPQCNNCALRGDHCITIDPRRPNAPPVTARRRTTSRPSHSSAGQRQRLDDNINIKKDRRKYTQTQAPMQLPQQEEQSMDAFAVTQDAAHDTIPQPHASRSTVLDQGLGLSFTPSSPNERTVSRPNKRTRSQSQTQHSATDSRAAANHPSSGSTRSHEGSMPELPTWMSRAYQEVSAEQMPGCPSSEPKDPSVAALDIVVNTDGSPHRLKVHGGSSLQCLFKFVDVGLATYGFDATAPLFRHGMTQSDEFEIPLLLSLPDLPERSLVWRCIDAFFDRIWPLFPVVDREAVQADADFLLGVQNEEAGGTSGRLQGKVNASRIASLSAIYAILYIGINELRSGPATFSVSSLTTSSKYLTACYSLHAHLTALPYHSSVQALLLLALSLRGSGKDGQAWNIVGIATRIAVSLGLHKSVGVQKVTSADDSFDRRLWWSCLSLERLLQLECGRPSSTDWMSHCDDQNDDQDIGNSEDPPEGSEENRDLLNAWVSLSGVMRQIFDKFYTHRFGNATEMLSQAAWLAQRLTTWEAGLPEDLKPSSSSFNTAPGHEQVSTVFLAQQLYHAQIAVLRVAILFPPKGFQYEVQKCSLEDAAIQRLAGAASQCVSAARNLITLTLQLADAGVHSMLISVPQTLLASVVISLSILRSPESRLARSDVELLTSATTFVEACYQAWGYPATFLDILVRLRERTAAISRGEARRLTPAPQGSNHSESTHTDHRNLGLSRGNHQDYDQVYSEIAPTVGTAAGQNANHTITEDGRQISFGQLTGMGIEDFWDMLKADMFMYEDWNPA